MNDFALNALKRILSLQTQFSCRSAFHSIHLILDYHMLQFMTNLLQQWFNFCERVISEELLPHLQFTSLYRSLNLSSAVTPSVSTTAQQYLSEHNVDDRFIILLCLRQTILPTLLLVFRTKTRRIFGYHMTNSLKWLSSLHLPLKIQSKSNQTNRTSPSNKIKNYQILTNKTTTK